MKKQLPDAVKRDMSLWRMGLGCLPKGYIDFHRGLTEQALEVLKENGFEIHRVWMDSDGWGDGMRCLWVIAEKRNELFKLHWHDSNQEFFVDLKGGGSIPFNYQEVQ